MLQTPKLGLPYLLPNQAQKHVTLNMALSQLDALVQLVINSTHPTAPPQDPEEGLSYILSTDATLSEWPVGGVDDIVMFVDGAWRAVSPREGWAVYDLSTKQRLWYDGQNWIEVAKTFGLNDTGLFGVNAEPDETNRLSVKSDAELLSHDDVTPGSGDARKIINKASPTHTASIVFQSAFTGVSELGICGTNDLVIKVNPDGQTWLEALIIDGQSGRVSFPHTPVRDVLATDRTYYVRSDGNNDNSGRDNTTAAAFATIQHAINHVVGSLDMNGNDVVISVGAGVYNEGIVVESGQVGAGRIRLVGDTVTPSNVVISSGGATSLKATGAGARLYISGIKVETNGFAGWHADAGGALISEGRNEIGQVGGHQIIASGPSMVRLTHNMIVSGGCAGGHIHASNSGFIYTQGASWTLVNNPSIGSFFQAQTSGVIYTFANTFDGTISGQKYSAMLNGIIQTNSGGNQNYLPGAAPGSLTSGGQYQ